MISELYLNIVHNLFKPLLLFFYVGFAIPLLRVRLEFPKALYQSITIYLLLAIGWHGGEELANLDRATVGQAIGFMLIGFVVNGAIGLISYFCLSRLTSIGKIDAATVAGYYGSDSAGTFITCVGVLAAAQIAYAPYMPVMLAAMEIPGCLIALFLVSRLRQADEKRMRVANAQNRLLREQNNWTPLSALEQGRIETGIRIKRRVLVDSEGGAIHEFDRDEFEFHTSTSRTDHRSFRQDSRQRRFDGKHAIRPEHGSSVGGINASVKTESRREADGSELSLDYPTDGIKNRSIGSWWTLHEVFLNPGIFLLFAGIAIGFLARLQGESVIKSGDELFVRLFQGILGLFLLEMGMTAAKKLPDLKRAGWKFVSFAFIAPNVFAIAGILVAHSYSHFLGVPFEQGTYVLFAVLCGSASYIAVPAVQRIAIPEASPTLPLAASLGVTFTYNVTIGIPLYIMIAQQIIQRVPVMVV